VGSERARELGADPRRGASDEGPGAEAIFERAVSHSRRIRICDERDKRLSCRVLRVGHWQLARSPPVLKDQRVARPNPTQPAPGMRLKGSTLRAYVNVLVKLGRRDDVMAIVPPDTARVLANPPLSGSWIDFAHILRITEAMETLTGTTGVRDFAHRAIDEAKGPHVRMLEGLLRLFGTSPATIFKRMNDLVKSTIENIEYIYTPISSVSGIMEVKYHLKEEVPMCMYSGGTQVLQAIFDACGVSGVIGTPQPRGHNHVEYRLQW
jgi:hypothetical protein